MVTLPEPRPAGADRDDHRAGRDGRRATLVARVAGGDSAAFAELYDDVSPLVHGAAVRVLRDPDHAADVTQEVMVELWRTAPRYDEHAGSVTGWVATIAHRRAVDRVRSLQSQRARDERVRVRDYEPPRDVVSEEAEVRQERQQVVRCLEDLTDLQRAAVEQTYYDGYTYREAAARTGVAEGTMKSRIRDALIRLRQCLEVA